MNKHLSSIQAHRWAKRFPMERIASVARTTAPILVMLAISGAAHTQGTVDLSGTNLMTSFKTFALFTGAVICLRSLIFAGIKMMSGEFVRATPGLWSASPPQDQRYLRRMPTPGN